MINDIDQSSVEMIDWMCCSCGCVQWMPKTFNEKLRSSHQPFYCLNGHVQVYTKKTELEEFELKLAAEYAKNAQLESRIKALEKENADMNYIKESLKALSDKASKSFLKKLFD
jgi:hypothetical protein